MLSTVDCGYIRGPMKNKTIKSLYFLLIVFILCELTCRAFIHFSGYKIEKFRPLAYYFKGPNMVYFNLAYLPNPFLPFTLRPTDSREFLQRNKFNNSIDVFKYRTNAFGFRGKDITMEKPENCLRVICLGGSTTFSTTNDDDTWPVQLERMLREHFPDKRVEVLNLGMNSASSPFSFILLALKGVHFKPDLVIDYEGFNDIWQGMGFKGGINTDYTTYLKDMSFPNKLQNAAGYYKKKLTPKFLYTSYFFSISDYLFDRFILNRSEDMSAHYINMMDKAPERPLKDMEIFISNLRSIAGVARSHNAKVLFSTIHTFDDDKIVAQVNTGIINLAGEINVEVVDQNALIPHNDKSIHSDNIHFTPYGNKIVAENFYRAILKYKLLQGES